MASISTYKSNETVVTVNGIYITGLSEDGVSNEKTEDFFEEETGCQGDVVINESVSNIGEITFTTLATSPQNNLLFQYAKNGTVFPIWALNKSLGRKAGGTKGRIVKYPSEEKGKTAGGLEWLVRVFDYEAN